MTANPYILTNPFLPKYSQILSDTHNETTSPNQNQDSQIDKLAKMKKVPTINMLSQSVNLNKNYQELLNPLNLYRQINDKIPKIDLTVYQTEKLTGYKIHLRDDSSKEKNYQNI